MERGRSISAAAEALRRGELVALPTETSYGLAADALNRQALERLFTVKQRRREEPVGIFLPSLTAVQEHCILHSEELRLGEAYWPGALNIVLTPRETSPLAAFQEALAPGRGKVSVRISSHPVVQGLLAAFGGPVTSTSANRSGAGDVYTADEITQIFTAGEIAYLLDGGALPKAPPSTVMNWNGEAWEVLRQGALTIQQTDV